MREKWKWITKTRTEVLARPAAMRTPVTDEEIESLRPALDELNGLWSARLQESGVTLKIRRVKSIWGTCHIRKRQITYNAEVTDAADPHPPWRFRSTDFADSVDRV